MKLYALPMACSLASHIAAYEADLPIDVDYIDNASKTTSDGRNYLAIAANGYVPAIELPSGEVLNENASVLQYLADRKPESRLAPAWGTTERYQLIDTLNYLGTEVHKRIFAFLFPPATPEASKEVARSLLAPTLDRIAQRLGARSYLVGESFTVADAYLVTLLNWFNFVGVDLAKWPTIAAYHRRHLERPAVQRAMAEEMAERQKRAA